ncbi:MAG: hypothetical protein KME42_22700 [Tildeniella nuda ZEHNDER 1965/U140]|nr:hypothetical protein [Tildeniella nuda ZEHNDER 1965/U140]
MALLMPFLVAWQKIQFRSSLGAVWMSDSNPNLVASEETPIPEAFVRRNRKVRNLVLDYALGAAIVGLNPFPGALWLTALIVIVLWLKMGRDIGKQWGYPRGQDVLAIAGKLFGVIGAFAIAGMTWLSVFVLGFFLPILRVFAASAALFTLTWSLGQSTHHFFASGRPRQLAKTQSSKLRTQN